MTGTFSPRALVALLLLCLPCAAAAEPPVLRHEVSVMDEVVLIGDLIDGAGALADIAIFRAPDLGHTGSIDATRVIDAARRHGLGPVETRGVGEVQVTRLSRHIEVQEIEAQVAAALAGRRGLGAAHNLSIRFDRDIQPLQVDASRDLRLARASFDPYSTRFDVTFELPGHSAMRPLRARYTGTVAETVEVAVLARPIGRSDVIRARDVVMERRPKSQVAAGSLTAADHMIGLAARRPLPAAQPVRAADLMKPELVRQNDLVTVIYEAAGINLTMRGKALESGSDGDTVNVVNVHTKRTMQGTVIGPSRVSLTAMTPHVLAADRNRVGSIAATVPQQRVE